MSLSASASLSGPIDDGCYCFIVEWWDSQASIARKYQLKYFLLDQNIEMYDIKARRVFLKRCAYPSINLKDLFIGATVTVYSRQLKILDYGDEFTRSKLEIHKTRSIVIIKSSALGRLGSILDSISSNGLTLSNLKMAQLSAQQAQAFTDNQANIDDYSNGPIVAVEMIGPDVVNKLKHLTSTGSMKGVISSDNIRAADLEWSSIFENADIGSTATFNNCTVAVIKPHAVSSGEAGRIISMIIEQGYSITAAQLFNMDREAAQEFLEVYKTVVPDYNAMVEQLTCGSSIAVELCGSGDIVNSFRQLCGPADPEIGRHIRPDTIRAKFGLSKVKNAIHCTDLPEDGPLESEFFFSILQQINPNSGSK